MVQFKRRRNTGFGWYHSNSGGGDLAQGYLEDLAKTKEGEIMDDYVSGGVGLGAVFASIISWSMWKSFWWMFLHGILGWIYVIYWGIVY